MRDVEQALRYAVEVGSPADTAVVASALAAHVQPNDIIVLGGDLGAGKTTFTKAFGAALGEPGPITSPTFTLAQRYDGGRLVVHHLDVWRIDQLDEVIDLALPELFESGGVVVIEWGDTIVPALPADYVSITFAFGDGDDDRMLTFTGVGVAWQKRLPDIASDAGASSC